MVPTITFLGAAGTVTGSKYLVDDGNRRILVDCGLFQGHKILRRRNWAPLPIEPNSIDVVLLTHAHLDHSGYLPLLVKRGFRGKVLCSHATAELCRILLRDAGHLAEREADFANQHGYSRHMPALPLFTEVDAERALQHFRPIRFHREFDLGDKGRVTFHRAGHILGAASIELNWHGIQILFSGDIGRYHDPLMRPPDSLKGTAPDFVLIESTYGDRKHNPRDPGGALEEVINPVIAEGGTVIIPAFAVGRAQSILYHLDRLKAEERIPKDLRIYLDSPMAIDASDIFELHPQDHNPLPAENQGFCSRAIYVRDMEQSKALTADGAPKIIISASGMATGGRVLHHLRHYAPDPRNAILFTGFQADGTRGAAMVAGSEMVKMFGQYVPVRAKVRNLEMLSAHADGDELMQWLGTIPQPPKGVFVVHGEAASANSLRQRIEEELGWSSIVPDQEQKVALG